MHQTQNYDTPVSKPTQKPNTNDRTFFALMEKVGVEGNYQTILSVILCLIGFITGGIVLVTPFLFYQDPYHCSNNLIGKQCLNYVCSLSSNQRSSFIPKHTIRTLPNSFGDYRCHTQKIQVDFVITMMYIGNVVGYLGLSLLGNLTGKKKLMLINLATTILGLLLTIFSVDLTMAGVGLFLSTLGIQNAFNICFFFISQTMSEHKRQKLQVIIQFFYSLGILTNVLWFYWLRDWQLIFTIFFFVPLVLATGCFCVFVADTPMSLVLRENSDKILREFRYIAKLNKKSCSISVEQIAGIRSEYNCKLKSDPSKKKKTLSILDLFKYKSLRMTTIFLVIVQCTVIFQFYAPALMLDQFNLNLFINGLVIGISSLLPFPLSYWMISRIKRKTAAYGCFLLTFICSLAMVFIWKQGEAEEQINIGNSIGVLALIFIFRFAISLQYTYFYVYFNELYPTQVRVLGTGFVATMGGVMVTVAPFIIEFCISGGFPIMIIFAVLSAVSGVCSSQLPQTLGADPHDEIQEIRRVKLNREEIDALTGEESSYGSVEEGTPSLREQLLGNSPQIN